MIKLQKTFKTSNFICIHFSVEVRTLFIPCPPHFKGPLQYFLSFQCLLVLFKLNLKYQSGNGR